MDHVANALNLDAAEAFWIDRVKDYFNSKPFTIRLDAGISLRTVVRDLIAQAEKRQKTENGNMLVGVLMQHLVGARLDVLLAPG